MLDGDESLAQLLREFGVRREVELVFLKNAFVDEGLEDVVDVVAAEVRVAVCGEDLVDIAFGGGNEFENGDVEGAAAEIVNGNFAALFFVETVRQGGCGWLVNETEDFEARDFAGVFGGLALGVVEVSGDGNDGAVNGLVEEGFGPAFQFAQDERGYLRWSEDFVAEHDADDVFAGGIDAE